MSVTVGTITVESVGSHDARLVATPATDGVGPYEYQWYRSTNASFSIGPGSLIAGATELTLNDSGLIPNVTYYYKLEAIDTGDSLADDVSSNVTVVTALPQISQNSFAQTSTRGKVDMSKSPNTHSALVDQAEAGKLYAGTPVKVADTAGGPLKVLACTADSDNCIGFVNYDVKKAVFEAGDPLEISMPGNVIELYATAPIARFARVKLDLVNGGVAPVAGSGGEAIVGYAYDKAVAAGESIRVYVDTLPFAKDA